MAQTIAEHYSDERMEALRRELSGRIDRTEEKLADCARTPWATVIAGASFLVVVIGGFGYLAETRFAASERADAATQHSIELINAELVRRRGEFVEVGEFREFRSRVLDDLLRIERRK
jgi:hypothetical protein